MMHLLAADCYQDWNCCYPTTHTDYIQVSPPSGIQVVEHSVALALNYVTINNNIKIINSIVSTDDLCLQKDHRSHICLSEYRNFNIK